MTLGLFEAYCERSYKLQAKSAYYNEFVYQLLSFSSASQVLVEERFAFLSCRTVNPSAGYDV